MDSTEQDALLKSALTHMRRRSCGYENTADRIAESLPQLIKSTPLPSVAHHGDAKLENFLLNEKNEVICVIDWELGTTNGFPLIDLFYLLTYNREIVDCMDFGDYYQLLANGNLRPDESRLLDRYRSKFQISEIQMKLLLVIFMVHHYGIRFHVTPENKNALKSYKQSLDTAIALIDQIQGYRQFGSRTVNC